MLFSIIIPAYNAEAYLAEAVESAFGQSLEPDQYEILLTDDGSSDGSWALMNRLAERMPNLRLRRHERNQGPGWARNRALEQARGEYVAFLDADDILPSNALEMYARALRPGRPEIIFADILKINQYGDALPLASGRNRHDLGRLKSRTIQGLRTFCAFGAVYRRDFLNQNKVRFSEGIFFEDIEFVCRAVLSASEVRGLADDLYYWRAVDGSTTASMNPRKIDDAVAAVAKMSELLDEYGLLEKHLDDWRAFGRRFIELTRRRLPEAGRAALSARLEAKIVETKVFQERGLATFLKEAAPPREPEIDLAALQEAAAGAVVMTANVDYQVRNFVPVARQLDFLGIKNVIFDVSGSKDFSSSRVMPDEEAAQYADVRLYRFDLAQAYPLFLNARAYLTAADWGCFRNLALTLRRRNIPLIGFYEGINDDQLLEPPAPPVKKFLPYRCLSHLLLPGEYYEKIYRRAKTAVTGLPALRSLAQETVNFPERPRAVINVNFSYGVLENARPLYLETAATACRKLGLDFIISQHPADKGDLGPVSDQTIYDDIRGGSVLISRFSTCVLEALALGKPVVYHNPHGEKFPKFQEDPMGAYRISHSVDSLAEALEEALNDVKNNLDIRARAGNFLQFHANIYAEQPPEHYAAAAIKEIVDQDADNFQKRLLHFAGGNRDDLPEPVAADRRLIWNFKTAPWFKKVLVMLLLDRPRLKLRLRQKNLNWLARRLVRLLPD